MTPAPHSERTVIEYRTGSGRTFRAGPLGRSDSLPGSGTRFGMPPAIAHQVLAIRYGAKPQGRKLHRHG